MTALAAHVAIPFVVENDVNLAALAHAWRGDGRHVDDFFTLYLGAGVGGAVVSNGRLVKGRHNGGGEVGYLLLDPADSGGRSTGPSAASRRSLHGAASRARARDLAGPGDHAGLAGPRGRRSRSCSRPPRSGDPIAGHRDRRAARPRRHGAGGRRGHRGPGARHPRWPGGAGARALRPDASRPGSTGGCRGRRVSWSRACAATRPSSARSRRRSSSHAGGPRRRPCSATSRSAGSCMG